MTCIKYTKNVLTFGNRKIVNYPKKLFIKGRTRQRLHNELKAYIPVQVINTGLMQYIENVDCEKESAYLFIDDKANDCSYCIHAQKNKGDKTYQTSISIVEPRFRWNSNYAPRWKKEERRGLDEED